MVYGTDDRQNYASRLFRLCRIRQLTFFSFECQMFELKLRSVLESKELISGLFLKKSCQNSDLSREVTVRSPALATAHAAPSGSVEGHQEVLIVTHDRTYFGTSFRVDH